MGAKGGKKTGGRTKGTPNKDTLPLREMAERIGVNPFEVLLRFAAGDWQGLGYDKKCTTKWTGSGIEYEEDTITPLMRLTAAKEAVQYLESKRKAIELSNSGESGFKVIIEDYSSGSKKGNAGT
jgi:hypothetical protein